MTVVSSATGSVPSSFPPTVEAGDKTSQAKMTAYTCTTFQGMKKLDLQAKNLNDLATLPPDTSVQVLDVGRNPEIKDLNALKTWEGLRILFAAALDQVEDFPFELVSSVPSLYMLAMRHCGLRALQLVPAASLVQPSPVLYNLTWLTLTNNRIEALPSEFGKTFRSVRKLLLTGNRLKALPPSFPPALELVRLSDNQIRELPSAFFDDCPKLAWTAFSGNPLPWLVEGQGCDVTQQVSGTTVTASSASLENGAKKALPLLDLEKDLCLKYLPDRDIYVYTDSADSHDSEAKVLGGGASGVVLQSKLRTSDQVVAVKIFKAGVTTDGDSRHELNILRRIGSATELCETTIQPLGLVADSSGKHVIGVVTSLLENYIPLGQTPSMASITRDVFESASLFAVSSTRDIVSICRDIAKAGAFLRTRNLFHGDMYAHNIICKRVMEKNSSDSVAHAVLTDYGAAFAVADDADAKLLSRFEMLELRAWTNLAEDLYWSWSEKRGGSAKVEDEVGKLKKLVDWVRTGEIRQFSSLLATFAQEFGNQLVAG
ncbi:unnamed protein product [Amoebophrya sp. A120]|nr:unnamed protein product [Amoebophrya sp. A120]|eukprot:GSA120T00011671001.1